MPKSRLAGPRETIRIVGIYLIAGGLWILLSDVLVWRFFPEDKWRSLSSLKGLLFVALTGALLSFLLTRTFQSIKKAQRELDAARIRFQLFMDNLPVAAFLKDQGGRYLFVNPYFRDRFIPSGGGKEESTVGLFRPDLVARFAEEDRRVLETGGVIESEIVVDGRDGAQRWLTRRFRVPMGNDDQDLVGGFAVDITERHRLEEQLRQTGKMEALGRVAGGIAHDFNNMLTVINGYASLLSRELEGTPGSRKAQEIVNVGERAAKLTQQLLAFSRRQQHHPERLDVNRVVREMEAVIRPLMGENVQIVHALDSTLPLIDADHGQLQQILLNLATNARDAMPQGGLLSLETRRLLGAEGSRVQLSVRDNGLGMDEQTKEHIFEPFFTTKPPGKGIGLGLATVYGAVRQNNASIVVESAPGQGTVFTITFPSSG